MLKWNKNRLGAIPPEKIVVENNLRYFLLVPDASFDLDAMCLYDTTAPIVQSGTRGFYTLVSRNCTKSAWGALVDEQDRGNTVLANTVTSVPGQRWDIVVTNNREAVALLAQPAGAYAIIGTDHTAPGTSPAPTKKKESNTAMILAGGAVGGILGLIAGGPVGAALGGAVGAFAGSLPD